MHRISWAALSVSLLTAVAATAQFPFGEATPVGGQFPELHADPLWVGNGEFGFRIDGAPPGGQVVLVVSSARDELVLGGIQVYPSLAPADLLLVLTGTAGGDGRLGFPLPIPGPPTSALAGLDLYAQAAVSDPGGGNAWGATPGLLLEVTLHPLLALAGTQSLGAWFRLVDPVLGTTTVVPLSTAPWPPLTDFTSAAFGNGGRDLALAGTAGFVLLDTLATPPVAAVAAGMPSSASAVAWDRIRNRIYVSSFAASTIHVVDGERASPSFGAVVGQAPGYGDSMALSAEGDLLATLSGGVAAFSITLYDADPASPGSLQEIASELMFAAPGFGSVFGVEYVLQLSPDGRIVTVAVEIPPVFATPSTIHRYDALLGQWIDHDPAAAGIQPLSQETDPLVPFSFHYLPVRDGSAYVVGAPAAVRLETPLSDPTSISSSATAIPLGPPGPAPAQFLAATPSGRYLVRRDAPQPGNADLWLVNVATGGEIPLGQIGVPEGAIAAWR